VDAFWLNLRYSVTNNQITRPASVKDSSTSPKYTLGFPPEAYNTRKMVIFKMVNKVPR
jgi:hypothetical protein